MDTSKLNQIADKLGEWLEEVENFADDFDNYPYYEPSDLESGNTERFLEISYKMIGLGNQLSEQSRKLQSLINAMRKSSLELVSLELELESSDFTYKRNEITPDSSNL